MHSRARALNTTQKKTDFFLQIYVRHENEYKINEKSPDEFQITHARILNKSVTNQPANFGQNTLK